MRPATRDCDCPHGFPLCTCAEGLGGAVLLYRSRTASAIAGWPSAQLDPAEVSAHGARMAAAARARKPRLPLGTPAPKPPADCGPCQQRTAGS